MFHFFEGCNQSTFVCDLSSRIEFFAGPLVAADASRAQAAAEELREEVDIIMSKVMLVRHKGPSL